MLADSIARLLSYKGCEVEYISLRNSVGRAERKKAYYIEEDTLKNYWKAARWISKHIPDISKYAVVLPQTKEPLYALFATSAKDFFYAEEGIGTLNYLSTEISKIKLRHRVRKCIEESFVKASSILQSDRTSRDVLRKFRWLGFINLAASGGIFCISKNPHPTVVYKCIFLDQGNFEFPKIRENIDKSKALLLGRPGEFNEPYMRAAIEYLKKMGINTVYYKAHPSARECANDVADMLPIIPYDDQQEPFLACAQAGIGNLAHFKSSAAHYADIFNQSQPVDRRIELIDLSDVMDEIIGY
jgi:hypothetical protein